MGEYLHEVLETESREHKVSSSWDSHACRDCSRVELWQRLHTAAFVSRYPGRCSDRACRCWVDAQDLRDVREHIHDCFDEVGTFLLPHPGFEVVNPNFDGDVEKIRKVKKALGPTLQN